MSKSSAALLAELQTKATAAVAHLEAMRERMRRQLDQGFYLDEFAAYDLLLAEGIHAQYREIGITADGTLRRHDGETDADMIQGARNIRQEIRRRLVEVPESIQVGLSAVRQHQTREGMRRFLRETEFLAKEVTE